MPNPIVQTQGDKALLSLLELERQSLIEARDDFDRVRIRDQAAAYRAAAEVIKHRDIRIIAAELVADAERAIAKANPPTPAQKRSPGRKRNTVIWIHGIPRTPVDASSLRRIRQAHGAIEDAEYEQVKADFSANGRAISRKGLINRRHHVTQNTGKVEWYTPPTIVEAAGKVMGGIDLDPATTAAANETIVKSEHFLTLEDDALSPDTEWMPDNGNYQGRVWLNPPYRQPDIVEFSRRLLKEIDEGTIVQAIWLSNNATETDWGQPLLREARAVCFPFRRISFLDENFEPRKGPTQGQMIIGLGPHLDRERFRRIF